MQVKKCEKCGKVYENLSEMICECGNDISLAGFIELTPNEETEEIYPWYRCCPSCNAWIGSKAKDTVIRECICGDEDIRTLPEDSVISREQMLILTGQVTTEKEEKREKITVPQEEKAETIRYVEMTNVKDGKIIKIEKGEFIIGGLGEIEGEYFFPLKYVGGKHMYMYVCENHVYIMDNESKNGTRINNRRIVKADGRVEVVEGDRITMADQIFEVRICR